MSLDEQAPSTEAEPAPEVVATPAAEPAPEAEVPFDGDAIDKLLAGAETEDLDFYIQQQLAGERPVSAELLAKVNPEGREAIAAILAKMQKAKPQADVVRDELVAREQTLAAQQQQLAKDKAELFDWMERPEVKAFRESLAKTATSEPAVPEGMPADLQAHIDALVAKRVAKELEGFYGNLEQTQAARQAEAARLAEAAAVQAYNEDGQKFIAEHKDELFVEGKTITQRQAVQAPDGRVVERDVLVPKGTELWERLEAKMVASGRHPKYPSRYAMDLRDAYRLAVLELADEREQGAAEKSMAEARRRVIQPTVSAKPAPKPPAADDYDAMAEFMDANPNWAQSVYEERFGRQ